MRRSFTSINECRQYICEDFRRFVEYAARFYGFDPPDIHYRIANWLQSGKPVNPRWVSRKKSLQGFRYLAKTTLVTRWLSGWRWLRCPAMQIKVHSSNDPNAKAMAKSINRMIKELPILHHLIPDDAGVYEFNLKGQDPEQGYSLQCAGIRTSVTSSRADLYIFDDPEPDDDPESMNERIVKAMMEATHILHRPDRHLRLFGGLDRIPVPELTQLIVVGQPHCANTVYFPHTSVDIHADSEGHPLQDAKYLIVPAVDKNGEWTWPEQMEAKYYDYVENRPQTVEEVEAQYTTENWQCQMQINPQYASGLGAVLSVREIVQQDRVLTAPFMAIDPADSNENGCEWGAAIGNIFHGTDGHQIHVCWMGGFVGEVYEGDDDPESRFTTGESVWRRIFDIAEEFRVGTILLEVNLKAAAKACERYMRKTGTSMRIEPIRASMNKIRRIKNAIEPPINNGMVSTNREVLADPMNAMQLTKLRHDKLPKPCDRLDALATLFDWLIENGPELANPFQIQGGPQYHSVDTLKFPTVASMGVPGASLVDRM